MKKPINPWAALDALHKDIAEPNGAEWFTVETYAKHAGMSYPGAKHRVHRWMREGRLDKWTGKGGPFGRRCNKYRVKA